MPFYYLCVDNSTRAALLLGVILFTSGDIFFLPLIDFCVESLFVFFTDVVGVLNFSILFVMFINGDLVNGALVVFILFVTSIDGELPNVLIRFGVELADFPTLVVLSSSVTTFSSTNSSFNTCLFSSSSIYGMLLSVMWSIEATRVIAAMHPSQALSLTLTWVSEWVGEWVSEWLTEWPCHEPRLLSWSTHRRTWNGMFYKYEVSSPSWMSICILSTFSSSRRRLETISRLRRPATSSWSMLWYLPLVPVPTTVCEQFMPRHS